MSGHDWEDGRREFTIENMQIGPTDANRLDPNDDISGTGDGVGHLGKRELTRPSEHDGAHYRPQSSGLRLSQIHPVRV
jgi:hypothetical protein